MTYNDYSGVTVRGVLGARAALLSARLEAPFYRPDRIFTIEPGGWPGDWEGRTILALTCLCRVTKREPSYLDEIVSGVASVLNPRGYLGRVLDGQLDEQQLSGHSWLLRGLCEYYLYRKENYVLTLIDGIIRGLFLPARGKYDTYPILPNQRVYRGGESGESAGLVGDWYISTDTGCAYIPLDGVTHAYEILKKYAPEQKRDEALSALIDEMVRNYMKIPFIDISVQTHATLTGCRGLIRRYEQTGNSEYLDFAKQVFSLYEQNGMTPTYANDNWFNRPEWTEPCAIIDSYMVAAQLYELTGKAHYAEISQLILYNGIYRAQRPNGGFGCDSCATDGIIKMHCYEAYWCCTMRGGEGLASAARYAVTSDGTIITPQSGDYAVNGGILKIKTDYPQGGKTVISYPCGGVLKLFVPAWFSGIKCKYITKCDYNMITLDVPKDAGEFEIIISTSAYSDKCRCGKRLYNGALLLGVSPETKINTSLLEKRGGDCFCGDIKLSAIDETYLCEPSDAAKLQYRVCFDN